MYLVCLYIYIGVCMFSFPMVSGEFYQTDLGKKLQPLASCDFFYFNMNAMYTPLTLFFEVF